MNSYEKRHVQQGDQLGQRRVVGDDCGYSHRMLREFQNVTDGAGNAPDGILQTHGYAGLGSCLSSREHGSTSGDPG